MPTQPICLRCASATPRISALATPKRCSNRPTVSPRPGHPTSPDTTVSSLSGPSLTRKPATPPPPSARSIPACEAGLAHRRGQHARVVALLEPRLDGIRLLGGSNAQRDLFRQILIDSAMRADRRDLVAAMIAEETATHAAPPTVRAGYATAARWLM
jgi:hypothetical protein